MTTLRMLGANAFIGYGLNSLNPLSFSANNAIPRGQNYNVSARINPNGGNSVITCTLTSSNAADAVTTVNVTLR